MRTTYRVFAYLIALGVVVQAAAIAYALFGLGAYIEGGGTLDSASQETASFAGDGGFASHGIGGMYVVPLLCVILLVVSFFARVPGGVKWAGIVLGLLVVQVALGLFAHGLPVLGLLHGVVAFALLGAAVFAGYRARAAAPGAARAEQPARVV